jgi:hypothetical protein
MEEYEKMWFDTNRDDGKSQSRKRSRLCESAGLDQETAPLKRRESTHRETSSEQSGSSFHDLFSPVNICRSHSKPEQTSPVRPVAGFIKCVYMDNFMGYHNELVNLSPQCQNVATIQKGSEAAMEALFFAVQIALGKYSWKIKFKAKDLGAIVREKSRPNMFVTIRVTFCNSFPGAFEHSIYGSEISLELRCDVWRCGYDFMYLLDSNGRFPSQSKEDLRRLLLHFHMDEATHPKAFLDTHSVLSNNPNKAFHLFLTAAGLTSIASSRAQAEKKAGEKSTLAARLQVEWNQKHQEWWKLSGEWDLLQTTKQSYQSSVLDARFKYTLSSLAQCQKVRFGSPTMITNTMALLSKFVGQTIL